MYLTNQINVNSVSKRNNFVKKGGNVLLNLIVHFVLHSRCNNTLTFSICTSVNLIHKA